MDSVFNSMAAWNTGLHFNQGDMLFEVVIFYIIFRNLKETMKIATINPRNYKE